MRYKNVKKVVPTHQPLKHTIITQHVGPVIATEEVF